MEDRLKLFEQPSYLLAVLVALIARKGELVADVLGELGIGELHRGSVPSQLKTWAKTSACSSASSSAWWVCSRSERRKSGRSPRPASLTVTLAFCWYIVLISSAEEKPKGDSPAKRTKYQCRNIQSKTTG